MEDLNLKEAGKIFAPGTMTNTVNRNIREQEFHASIINNTFVYNFSQKGGAIDVSDTDETPVIFNNIFWQNTADEGVDINSQYQKQLLISYNDIDVEQIIHPWTGEGNIYCNPTFNGDSLHIHWESECLNSGAYFLVHNEVTYHSPEKDIDGDDRPYGNTAPDIGADESPYFNSGYLDVKSNTDMLCIAPNPFSKVTTIKYDLKSAGHVQLFIYNHLGEEVAVLVNGYRSGGEHQLTWQANKLPAGVYFFVLKSGSGIQTVKLIKL
jgi:hypothetical protein